MQETQYTFLREVDLIKDREYILQKLEESENSKTYTLEESYALIMQHLDELEKKYERI